MNDSSQSRRTFIKSLSGGMASAFTLANPVGALSKLNPSLYPRVGLPNPFVTPEGKPVLVCVKGTDINNMLATGLTAIGGLGRLINSDQDVLIKPNFLTDQYYPASTDPDFLTELIMSVVSTTNGTVYVGDQGWRPPQIVYPFLNLDEIVPQAGGELIAFSNPYNVRHPSWDQERPDFEVYSEVYDAPIIINLCNLKKHFQADLTCAIKNHVGAVTGSNRTGTRLFIHANHSQFLREEVAEIAGLIRPELNIVDARVLMTIFGPVIHEETVLVNTDRIIICGDIVATDAYCANLLEKHDPTFSASMAEPTLQRAEERGLGTSDLDQVEIIELNERPEGGSIWSRSNPSADASISTGFSLRQNYPNPFNESTTIGLNVPRRSPVSIRLYNILGKEVCKVYDGILDAGSYTLNFRANGLASGEYLYRLMTPGYFETKRMLLVK
ncbi:MAG: DUF362 domain-containing protein [candidate division Zixibacteria bacterium]|nr:DUF362 domain-containing protein [candidate division Zixibacteria bacterium]